MIIGILKEAVYHHRRCCSTPGKQETTKASPSGFARAKTLADRIGYTKTIEKAGRQLVTDTCIDEPCGIAHKKKTGIACAMTDSPK